MLKLNLGAGERRIAGWVSVDLHDADVCHDLGVFPWPFESDSAEHILASHVLEHFDRETGEKFVAECWRVLKLGGRLSIAVPDFDKFIQARVTGDYAPLGGYPLTDLNHLGGGGPEHEPREEWRHKYAYCWRSLRDLLREFGFVDITRRGPAEFDTAQHEAFSLYVDALK